MSPKRALRALLRPREAFDGWVPGRRTVVAAVVVLCALNGASVAYAGDLVTDEVSGSVTVDNPDHPPDWACGDSTAVDLGDCDAPETIEEPLGPPANAAVGGATMAAVFAPITWILTFAGLFVVLSGAAGGRDGEAVDAFRDGAGVAAIAAAPGILRSLVRPLAVERSLADWSYPTSLDGVGPAAVDALTPEGTLWLAVVVLTGVWTAAVVYGGARAFFDAERVVAGAGAVAALLTVAGSVFFADGGLSGAPFGLGLLLAFVGAIGFLGAYTYISISKSFELIGFSGSREVTPDAWYVGAHRLGGLALLAVGFLFVDGLAFV